jgi:pimeloyl-ACP methyl ester carboxylesterase
MDVMVHELPNVRLEIFPYVGHSMNLEQPLLFARVFGDFFRG